MISRAIITPAQVDPCSPLDGLHVAAQNIFRYSLTQCSIEAAFDRHLCFEGDMLVGPSSHPDGPPAKLPLSDFKRIFIVAIGKAALPMIDTLLARMPRRKGVRGICCAPSLPTRRNWRIRNFAGGHPLPNKDSFAAARATLQLLRRAKKDTLVLFLISGGGSAMFELPLDESISLEDTIAFHEALLGCGGTIAEINTVRKHFSAVKGGRLATAAPEATRFSLLLPDVPLRYLDALASSPTLPDRSTVAQAREILKRYGLPAKFPQSVRHFFEREDLPETPGDKEASQPPFRGDAPVPLDAGGESVATVEFSTEQDPNKYPQKDTSQDRSNDSISESKQDSKQYPRRSQDILGTFATLLTSDDLVRAAAECARSLGYAVVVDNSCDDWDYADAARYLLSRFHTLRQERPKLCLISSGEVTIKLSGTPGIGGRNQHFALTCALDLARFEGQPLAAFSAGSDGIDGNSSAAGAIADTTTICRARSYGFDAEDALRRYDSCPLFTALGDSVVTGPTNHNLRDLRLLISDASQK